jgi:four helix bundle protein
MAYESFEELKVWQECREFRKSITLLTKKFPKEEKYRLIDQIIRSSRSVTANIAEGHGRFHYQENIQSCRQARGSLTETLDHLIVAYDEGYIDSKTMEALRKKYSKCHGLLNGYISYLKTRKSEDK